MVKPADFMNLTELEELMRKQKNKRNYERLLAIRMLMLGANPDDIAEEINRSRATIYNWAALWNKNGWESLKYKPSSGKKPKLTLEDLAELKDILELTFKRLSDIPHNFYCYRLHLLHNY